MSIWKLHCVVLCTYTMQNIYVYVCIASPSNIIKHNIYIYTYDGDSNILSGLEKVLTGMDFDSPVG